MAEKCTNTSLPPSEGEIKPKPLDSLNHLTVPVVILNYLYKILKNGLIADVNKIKMQEMSNLKLLK
jgi:hypothetical protein